MVRKHYYNFRYSANMLKIGSHGFDLHNTVNKPCKTSEMELFLRSHFKGKVGILPNKLFAKIGEN